MCLCLCFYAYGFSYKSGKYMHSNTCIALRMNLWYGKNRVIWMLMTCKFTFVPNDSLNFIQATTYLAFPLICLKPFQIQNTQNKTCTFTPRFSLSLIKAVRQLLWPLKYSCCIFLCSLPIFPLPAV